MRVGNRRVETRADREMRGEAIEVKSRNWKVNLRDIEVYESNRVEFMLLGN